MYFANSTGQREAEHIHNDDEEIQVKIILHMNKLITQMYLLSASLKSWSVVYLY